MSTLLTTNLKNASSGSNNIVLNTDGTTTIAAPSNIIKSGTAVASTSGVAIDFTGIPSWVKRVTVMFSGVSTSGTSSYLIQLGAGSITTSGYSGVAASSGNLIASSTAGFILTQVNVAASTYNGHACITNVTSNTWVESSTLLPSGAVSGHTSGGTVGLSGTLDRIRITTVNGTDTFDAGSINILWEG